MRIEGSQENIVVLSDIRARKSGVSSHFGPLNPASTTLLAQETHRENQLARLSELLNSLENVVDNLNYKSFTAYATLANATENLRAVVYDTLLSSDGTDNE